jgi:hypothetical protein
MLPEQIKREEDDEEDETSDEDHSWQDARCRDRNLAKKVVSLIGLLCSLECGERMIHETGLQGCVGRNFQGIHALETKRTSIVGYYWMSRLFDELHLDFLDFPISRGRHGLLQDAHATVGRFQREKRWIVFVDLLVTKASSPEVLQTAWP